MLETILLFGGRSDERMVSVASAQNLDRHYPFSLRWFIDPQGRVFETALNELRSHERPFEAEFAPRGSPIAPSLASILPKMVKVAKNTVFFIALHGTEGEDGQLQEQLANTGIAFTGSDAESSHNCFDKALAKKIVEQVGLKVAAQAKLSAADLDSANGVGAASELLKSMLAKHGKIVLKPIRNGSSIGLHFLETVADITATLKSLKESRRDDYLLEAFISGRELTVGVIHKDDEQIALPASEVLLKQGFQFDYNGKYLGQGTQEITPAELDPAQANAAKSAALKAHQALSCFGYSRTDLILTPTGIVFLETNTLPGLTRASFIPQQLSVARVGLTEFVEMQIRLACLRQSRGS